MVKSKTLFCRLVGIDTLLSFNGIIPSAADFQLRLTTLIEQFNKALLAENHSSAESESLCRALCCYFDQRLIREQKNNSLSWQRYSLVNYFYGHTETEQTQDLSAQLDALFTTESEAIFAYAWKLLTLLIQVEGQTETLVSLRTASHGRYASRKRSGRIPEKSKSGSWLAQDPKLTGSPRLMVVIIGPFAEKWFSQADLSSDGDNDIIWVVAGNASTLMSRLTHLEKNREERATLAYFPLLADGLENSAIIIEQITAWQHAFSSVRLPYNLPCMLGFYSRLSQQRFPHDPERAIWTGSLDETLKNHLKLETRLAKLIAELDARANGSDLYAIQRHALGSILVAWLAEKRIMRVLQELFDTTQFDLAGVTIADHGEGFTRHGAWSLWLAEKYAILPGLSASIAMPPLPAIPRPLLSEPEPVPSSGTVVTTLPPPEPRRYRLRLATLLMLLFCVSGGFYYYVSQHFEQTTTLPESAVENEAELFALSGTAPLFENGSSILMPDSEKMLAELVPKMTRLPHQQFLIIGHSDNTGSDATNLALSNQRAKVIRDWLIEHTGLPASHFIVGGVGNSQPIASNTTREGRAKNRRVEIIPLSLQNKNKD